MGAAIANLLNAWQTQANITGMSLAVNPFTGSGECVQPPLTLFTELVN